MYEHSETLVRRAVGVGQMSLRLSVGLHQGSALRPFLFLLVMDNLSNEVRQEFDLGNSKDARKVEVVKGDVFKYLGSTIQSNGQYIKQVKKKVLAELRESRVISGRICLKDVSESCHFVWFGDGGPNKKIGS